VQDDGGTANGGANTDASPNTFTFNVTPLNDAPAAVANMGTTNEDTVLNVAAAGVLGNDTDPDSGDVLLVAAVNGNAANVGNSIALASGALLQVNADGSYSYDPNGAFNSLAAGVTTTDSFTYTASDGNGGTDSATVTITITGVNDAPTLTANNLTITNGATITLTLSNLGASDPDNVWADLSYSVSGVTNGQFELTSAPGVAVTTFTQGDVAAGFVVFVHAGNSLAPAYTIKAFDGALSSTASGATVNFTRSDPTLPPSPPSASGSSRDTTVAPPSEPPPASNPSRSTGDDTASPLDGPAPVPRSSGAEVIAIPEPEVAAPVAYAAERVIAEKLKIIEPKIEPMTMISEAPTVVGTEQSFRPEFVQTRSQEITVDLGHIVLKEQDGDRLIRIDLNALRMASLALTIGAVLWATRATGLLACLLSSLPAWRNFDPLPVLARDEDEEREDEWVKAHDAHADEDAEREESALNHTFSNRDSQPVEVEKVRSQLRG
jgi:VCBS repeat-containing protein